MKKVMWVSKNFPLQSQILELRKLYGDDVFLFIHSDAFADAKEIIGLFKEGGYDEMVLIAPLSVCRVMIELGIKPLWSQMEQVPCGDPRAEVSANGRRSKIDGQKRCYRFIRFRRLESIDLVFSDLPIDKGVPSHVVL